MSGTLVIPAGALRGRDLSKLTSAQIEALGTASGRKTPAPSCHATACRLPKKGCSYHTEGVPNGLESDYAAYLDTLMYAGKIVFWKFEKIRLTLADRTTYMPDFFVVMADGTPEFHETKGFRRDDAMVKIKVAAHSFPCFIFREVQRKERQWVYQTFGPGTTSKEAKKP